jgi:hypothetical protein
MRVRVIHPAHRKVVKYCLLALAGTLCDRSAVERARDGRQECEPEVLLVDQTGAMHGTGHAHDVEASSAERDLQL